MIEFVEYIDIHGERCGCVSAVCVGVCVLNIDIRTGDCNFEPCQNELGGELEENLLTNGQFNSERSFKTMCALKLAL